MMALLGACKNEVLQTAEDNAISSYLAKQVDVPPATNSGLYFFRAKMGNGKLTKVGDQLRFQINIRLLTVTLDGEFKSVLSTYPNNPDSCVLGTDNRPAFLAEALSLMHQGDSVKLVVPSSLAYGIHQTGSVPPYTPLLVTMELLEIK
jgi:FKBP-type peptidyl-prolyl cis-trans isomerase FklB